MVLSKPSGSAVASRVLLRRARSNARCRPSSERSCQAEEMASSSVEGGR